MTEAIYDNWGRTFTLPGLYEDFPNFFKLVHLDDNDVPLDTIEIEEPVGWNNLKMTLKRDENGWHGVNYEYSSSSAACEFDGYSGRDFIESIFRAKAEDASILLQFGVRSPTDDIIEFEARLDLSTRQTNQRRTSCALERKNLHSRVLARWGTEIDLSNSRSIDGVEMIPPEFVNIPLTAQSLEERFQCRVGAGKRIEETFQGDTDGHVWVHFDLSQPQINEIADASGATGGLTDSEGLVNNDEWAFKFRSSGIRQVEVLLNYKIECAVKKRTISIGAAYVTGYSLTTVLTHVSTDGTHKDYDLTNPLKQGTRAGNGGFRQSEITVFPGQENKKVTVSLDTKAGDKLFMYGLLSFDHNKNELQQTQLAFTILTQSILITGSSQNQTTPARSLPIGQAINTALGLATGFADRLRSSFYGLQDARYAVDGCGARRVYLNGYAIRQFKANERPLTASLQDLLTSLREIDCIGLSYGSEINQAGDPVDIVNVEPIQHFYRPVELLRLDEVSDYREQSIANELFTTVEVGYEDYLKEGASALEELFTIHQMTTPIRNAADENVKKPLTSKLIASSLIIERTRREQFTDTPKDSTSYDEKGFLIQCKPIDDYRGMLKFTPGFAGGGIIEPDSPITWLAVGLKVIVSGAGINDDTYTITYVGDPAASPWTFHVAEDVGFANAPNAILFIENSSLALQPETGADFEKVTGLTSPDTTYNLRLSPGRMTWNTIPVWGGCLLNKDKYALINKAPLTETGLLPVSFNDNNGYSTIRPDHYIDWLTVGMVVEFSGNTANVGKFTIVYVADATTVPWIFFVREPVTNGSATLVNISFSTISDADLTAAVNKTKIPKNKKVTTLLPDIDSCGRAGIVSESAAIPIDQIIPNLLYLPRLIKFSVRLSRQQIQRLRLGHSGLLPAEVDDNGDLIDRNYGYVSLLDERGIRVGGYLTNVEYSQGDEKAVFELRELALDINDTTQGLDCSQFVGITLDQAQNLDAKTRRRIELCRFIDVDPL